MCCFGSSTIEEQPLITAYNGFTATTTLKPVIFDTSSGKPLNNDNPPESAIILLNAERVE